MSTDFAGNGVPVAGSTITATNVIDEGQFLLGHFPRCSDQSEWDAFIEERILDSADFVSQQTGSYYESTDSKIQRQMRRAVLFLTCSRLWQTIKNVMDGYDAESLPPEFVQPDQAAANRDYYATEANRILMQHDSTPAPNAYVGMFTSGVTE